MFSGRKRNISTVLIAFSFSDNRCECESSVVTAVLGGVLAVVIVTAIVVQVMVIVFFMRKLHAKSIRASVDALCRDGASEISRDPRTKRLQTRRESLARPSKHTNNNF